MSQNWHAHWMEENYKSTRLGNWQVPKWYPQWPVRHCVKTTFQCDNKGHLLAHLKKTNHERENFKTAWEYPKKISRQLAVELSAPPKYKKQFWKNHKAFHRASCGELSKQEKGKINKLSSSENNLTRGSIAEKEIKSEPFDVSKANPEAEEKLIQQSPILDMKKDSQNSNENSLVSHLNSSLVLDKESFDIEKKNNKLVCPLRKTCKM